MPKNLSMSSLANTKISKSQLKKQRRNLISELWTLLNFWNKKILTTEQTL